MGKAGPSPRRNQCSSAVGEGLGAAVGYAYCNSGVPCHTTSSTISAWGAYLPLVARPRLPFPDNGLLILYVTGLTGAGTGSLLPVLTATSSYTANM